MKPPVGDIGESNDWNPPKTVKCRFVNGVGSSTKISTPESSEPRSEGRIEINGRLGGFAVDGVGPETWFIDSGVTGESVDVVAEFAVADNGGAEIALGSLTSNSCPVSALSSSSSCPTTGDSKSDVEANESVLSLPAADDDIE